MANIFKKYLPALAGGAVGFMVGGPAGAAIGAGLGDKVGGGGLLGTKQKDQTTTTAPWSPQQPYLQDIFKQGQSLYNQNPGGMNQATQMGVSALMRPDQNVRLGSGLLGSTIRGSFLNNNPYLDQTFNRAASSVGNNIASRFAGSGRFGSGAMFASMNDGMNNLADEIYGGNYQLERGRQMQAVGMAPQLADFDANRFLQAGQIQRQLPWDQLAKYQGAVSGNYGGTSTTPIYSNPASGILGGALLASSLFGGGADSAEQYGMDQAALLRAAYPASLGV